MSKPINVLLVLLAMGFGCVGVATAGDATGARPNILFIAVDDLKPLTLHYGDQKVKTPTLDRLASQSTVFTRAYTQYPVCGPSRSSLLTGLRPESNGVMDQKTRMRDINPDILTLPQFFKNHGYKTAASGKNFDPRNVDSRDDDDPASWSIPYEQTLHKADASPDPNLAVRPIDAPAGEFIDGDINSRMDAITAPTRPSQRRNRSGLITMITPKMAGTILTV